MEIVSLSPDSPSALLAAVHALRVAVHQERQPGSTPPSYADSVAALTPTPMADVAGWAALDGDALVGFAVRELAHGANAHRIRLDGAVRAEARRRGVGRTLLDAALSGEALDRQTVTCSAAAGSFAAGSAAAGFATAHAFRAALTAPRGALPAEWEAPLVDVLRAVEGHHAIARVRRLLSEHGIEGGGLAAWTALWRVRGEDVTTVDRYAIEARDRGCSVFDLPLDERLAMAHEGFRVMYAGFEFTPASSRGGEQIEVVAYDPAWAAAFEAWRAKLVAALPSAVRVEHVGSTAVPRLPAKPVIDIQVSVQELADEASYVPALETLRVQLRNRDDDHRFFRPFAGQPRDVQVHVTEAGSSWEHSHLLFRDFLRAYDDARDAYADMKRRMALVWRDDRNGYTAAKTHLILATMKRARAWADESGWQLVIPHDGVARRT